MTSLGPCESVRTGRDTPLGSCGVSFSGFEERGDANDQYQLHRWKQPLSCVSPPKGRRRNRRCCSQHRSSEHRGYDLLVVTPYIVHEEPPKRRLHCFPLLSAPPGADPWLGNPEVRILPAPRVLALASAYRRKTVGICGLHTYTAHLADRRFRRTLNRTDCWRHDARPERLTTTTIASGAPNSNRRLTETVDK